MDIKNIDLTQLRNQLRQVAKKVSSYRFYIVSIAVLILLSIVIIDVGVVSDIEPDASKIQNPEEASHISLDQSVIDEVNQRVNQSGQSTTSISGRNPFTID